MVSTNGTFIHGKNRGLGWRTRQVEGHLSDASLQQLSKDMNKSNVGWLNPRSSIPGAHVEREVLPPCTEKPRKSDLCRNSKSAMARASN